MCVKITLNAFAMDPLFEKKLDNLSIAYSKSPERDLNTGFREGWVQIKCDKWADKTISAHCDIGQC